MVLKTEVGRSEHEETQSRTTSLADSESRRSEIFGRIVPRRKKRRFRWLMMGGMLRKVMEGGDGGYGEVDSSAAYNDTVAIAITTYAGRLLERLLDHW